MSRLINAGLISMGGYLPAKEVPASKKENLVKYLRKETLLHHEYIDEIDQKGHMPGRIETNYDGWESQPWFDEWVSRMPPKKQADPFQGAVERRRVPMDPVSLKKSVHPHPMLSSDAETLAAAKAIYNAGIDKDEIDLVLCSSLVPDLAVPQNASLVQHKLGLKNAGAINVDTCCSSFITMMEIAMNYVRLGMKKKVLIVGSSLDSLINDKCSYFSVYVGDGAVAGIVGEVEEGYGYISSHSHSIGKRHKAIIFQTREPALLVKTSQGPSYEQEFVTFYDKDMQREIAHETQNDIKRISSKLFAKTEYTEKDIDFLSTHQPVPWTPDAWRECLGVPKEKLYHSWEKYGNIAVASSAVNMMEAVEKGLMKAGDKHLIISSGVGENHIGLYHRISPVLVENVKHEC
ncbi:MAG: 3-oxoacyl-[acyl-carrier-protein] synthase III C-terminal domain-containing protein [Spirochaetales bacterium]|nr:3-oxoacyl-[acyl-carrier-protein] synthase III C-terminal domain-containing protein [Spirochaetales bacterium]